MNWRDREKLIARPAISLVPPTIRSPLDLDRPAGRDPAGTIRNAQHDALAEEFRVGREMPYPAAHILGRPIRTWPLYRRVITDDCDQLDTWSLTGLDAFFGDWPYDEDIAINLVDEEGDRFITLSYDGEEIAEGARAGDGTITLNEKDDSGISGSVDVTYTADGDFTLNVKIDDLAEIDEPAGGTHYTDYAIIKAGPVCAGWLSLPECSLRTGALGDSDDATAWVQLCEEDETLIEEHACATLSAEGAWRNGSAPPFLIKGDNPDKTIARIRWKVTGGDNLYFDLVGEKLLTDLAAP